MLTREQSSLSAGRVCNTFTGSQNPAAVQGDGEHGKVSVARYSLGEGRPGFISLLQTLDFFFPHLKAVFGPCIQACKFQEAFKKCCIDKVEAIFCCFG